MQAEKAPNQEEVRVISHKSCTSINYGILVYVEIL